MVCEKKRVEREGESGTNDDNDDKWSIKKRKVEKEEK
jgi:hypothetical protein